MRIGYGTSVTVPSQTEIWLSNLQAGKCFGGYIFQAAVAAQYSHAQLFNPVGSGKTLLVRATFADVSIAAGIAFGFYNVALATLGANLVNLLSASAAPSAEIRSGTNAAQLGTFYWAQDFAALDFRQIGSDWQCQLPAGKGLVAVTGQVNAGLTASFFWMEV